MSEDEKRRCDLERLEAKISSIVSSVAWQKRMCQIRETLHSWQYGKTGGIEKIVSLADKLRGIKEIDEWERAIEPSQSDSEINVMIRQSNAKKLADWNATLKVAVDRSDDQYFEDIAKALRLLKESETPDAKRDCLFFAIHFADDMRVKGINPTKKQVREAVEAFRKQDGRVSGTVAWSEIWNHPELKGLVNDSKRGRKPSIRRKGFNC